MIAVGTNEVPRPGGGAYWEGDLSDAREFTKGHDTNDLRKARIARDLVDQLIEERLVPEEARIQLARRAGKPSSGVPVKAGSPQGPEQS